MRKPKFLKKLAVLVSAGALALSLTGCGGMTLEKLMVEMSNAMEGKEMYEAAMVIELDASMTSEGETQDITADLALDTQISTEPAAMFMDIEIDADAAGESINETMQLYAEEEEGSMVGYVYMDSYDMWTKADMGVTGEELFAVEETEEGTVSVFSDMPEDLALAEETEIVENRESYVLTGTFTGEELMESADTDAAMAEAEDALSELGLDLGELDIDLSSITVPTTIYVDAETFMPIRIELEVQGLTEVIDGLLDTVMDTMMSAMTGLEGTEDLGIDTSELEAEMGAMDISIDVTTCKLVINELGYEPVEVPSVPEEGKEAAAQQEIAANQFEFEAAQADGSYIIQEGGYAVRVSPVEGWTTAEYAYDYVYMMTDDGMQEVSATMYTDMTAADFAYYVEDYYVPALQDEGLYVSHGIGPEINGFQTMYIEATDGIMLYYAGKPVGNNGWIDIEAYDYEGNEIEDSLGDVLAAIEEYQL